MDFLSIRKKARERSEAKEAASPDAKGAPEREAAPAAAEEPPSAFAAFAPEPAPPVGESPAERRRSGEEPVLTDADLAEGALQARLQGLAPAADARFATWRPGSGPPPVEPDPHSFAPAAPSPVHAPIEVAAAPPMPEPLRERLPAPPLARLARSAPPAAADPLDTFFFRPDEEAAVLPALGGVIDEEPHLQAPEQLEEYLTFLLGKEEYAIPIEHVREVLRAPNVTEVPRAPAHVLGVVTVRGEVVAVLDARRRLGLEGDGTAGGRIVIVDAGQGAAGLLVDAVSSVVRLPRGSIEPCPQGISVEASDCVTGIGRFRDRLFMVVDVPALLARGRPAEER